MGKHLEESKELHPNFIMFILAMLSDTPYQVNNNKDDEKFQNDFDEIIQNSINEELNN
jgi:hypothetical protein